MSKRRRRHRPNAQPQNVASINEPILKKSDGCGPEKLSPVPTPPQSSPPSIQSAKVPRESTAADSEKTESAPPSSPSLIKATNSESTGQRAWFIKPLIVSVCSGLILRLLGFLFALIPISLVFWYQWNQDKPTSKYKTMWYSPKTEGSSLDWLMLEIRDQKSDAISGTINCLTNERTYAFQASRKSNSEWHGDYTYNKDNALELGQLIITLNADATSMTMSVNNSNATSRYIKNGIYRLSAQR